MKLWGLTGGIGAGKSVVREILEKIPGVNTLDTDRTAKHIYQNPLVYPEVHEKIRTRFGISPGTVTGLEKLSSLIFQDPQAKKDLEAIVHPVVRARVHQHLSSYQERGTEVLCLESAILVDIGWERYVDGILYVWAPDQIRARRVLDRDTHGKLSAFDINARMQSQWTPQQVMVRLAEQRIPLIVITNEGTMDSLNTQVQYIAPCLKDIPERSDREPLG